MSGGNLSLVQLFRRDWPFQDKIYRGSTVRSSLGYKELMIQVVFLFGLLGFQGLDSLRVSRFRWKSDLRFSSEFSSPASSPVAPLVSPTRRYFFEIGQTFEQSKEGLGVKRDEAGDKSDARNKLLIVALGNFGEEYDNLRHNLGFRVIDAVATHFNVDFKYRRLLEGEYASFMVGSRSVGIFKPGTYMNLNGRSMKKVMQHFELTMKDVLVLHDEVDIGFAEMKMRRGGNLRGHNGLRSVSKCLTELESRTRADSNGVSSISSSSSSGSSDGSSSPHVGDGAHRDFKHSAGDGTEESDNGKAHANGADTKMEEFFARLESQVELGWSDTGQHDSSFDSYGEESEVRIGNGNRNDGAKVLDAPQSMYDPSLLLEDDDVDEYNCNMQRSRPPREIETAPAAASSAANSPVFDRLGLGVGRPTSGFSSCMYSIFLSFYQKRACFNSIQFNSIQFQINILFFLFFFRQSKALL